MAMAIQGSITSLFLVHAQGTSLTFHTTANLTCTSSTSHYICIISNSFLLQIQHVMDISSLAIMFLPQQRQLEDSKPAIFL